MLLRTPADASLSDEAKLDYAAGAVLRDGLEQRRPAPEVLSPSGWLDTAEALPALSRADQSRYDKLIATAKQAAMPEAQAAKDVWTTEHVRACTSKALRVARTTSRRKCVHQNRQTLPCRAFFGAISKSS